MIEVLEDASHFVLQSAGSSLWCNKQDGSLSIHSRGEIVKLSNPECLGVVEAVIGKFKTHPEAAWKLLLVGDSEFVGNLPPTMQPCHKVTSLVILTLAPQHPSNQLISLKTCQKHKGSKEATGSGMGRPLRKTWNQFVIAAESIKPKKLNFRLPIGTAASNTTSSSSSSSSSTISPPLNASSSSILFREMRDKERYEKRILEELQRMFEESPSFYFSPISADLTNCTQTLHKKLHQPPSSASPPPSISRPSTPPPSPPPPSSSCITQPSQQTASICTTNAKESRDDGCSVESPINSLVTDDATTTTSTTTAATTTATNTTAATSTEATTTTATSPAATSTAATNITATAITTTNGTNAIDVTATDDSASSTTVPLVPSTLSTDAAAIINKTTTSPSSTTITTTTSSTTIKSREWSQSSTDIPQTTSSVAPINATESTITAFSTTATTTPATTTTKKAATTTPTTPTTTETTTLANNTTTSATTTTTSTTTTTTSTTTTTTSATTTTASATTITDTATSATAATKLGWRTADDRFFWNRHMISELIDFAQQNELADEWITPILHGFVQIQECPIRFDDGDDSSTDGLKVRLCVVSRRSRYRAGTRYKRRGVDEQGCTANFVETEQIVEFLGHVVSFIQVRGSVPLYWSQSGIKYKPLPKIERSFDENHESFSKHLLKMLNQYDKVNIINLVDQAGKEREVGEAYLHHLVALNHPCINYTSFDFHEYCRGMRFENISILTENLMEQVQEIKYCWVDGGGMICEQKGVFRVNCIDCLDRTNIVQSALARVVLEMQCRKLGLLSPERQLPTSYRQAFQAMWANNGDVISRQYAGTAALKGDFTRTGERRLAGMMKDGVNSANRYFINRVRDVFRQACHDLMQGYHPATQQQHNELDGGTDEGVMAEDDMKALVEDCSRMIVNQPEVYLGGWGLVNADRLIDMASEGSLNDVSNPLEMDAMLFLSDSSVYIADYDDDTDTMTCYKKIGLSCLTYIQIGLLSLNKRLHQVSMRMNYSNDAGPREALFYSWLIPGTRLSPTTSFSGNKSLEEARENLFTMVGSVVNACKAVGTKLLVDEKKVCSDERSGRHSGVVVISQQAHKEVEYNMTEPPSTLSGIPTPNLPFPLSNNFEDLSGNPQKDDHPTPKFYSQQDEQSDTQENKQGDTQQDEHQDTQQNGQGDTQRNSQTAPVSINTLQGTSPLLCVSSMQEQQTRHLQAVLEGSFRYAATSSDHCVLMSCGLLMTRRPSQVAVVASRKVRAVDACKVVSKELSGGVDEVDERALQRQVTKLESKSKSMDTTTMLAKLTNATNIPAIFTPPEEQTPPPAPFKASHSDYELLQKTSDVSPQLATGTTNSSRNSPFLKLKMKVAQLTPSSLQASLGVPSLFTPSSSNHQALRNSARAKLLTSQTRFQHLNSKIILL